MYSNQNSFKTLLGILILFIISGTLLAQGDIVIPENEPLGDPNWNFKGRMNGNRVFETFWNHGEIGAWNAERQNQDDSDWPAGGLRNPYLDGVGMVVGGSVIDTLGNRVQMTSANYREEVDRSPDLETIWGWHPIPGYLNFDRVNSVGTREPIPATSNDPTSWPDIWIDQPTYFDEDGNVEWNGRFGRGRFNAQLEAYYVMDDAIDYEFGYVPVPSKPDRGGLGLRTTVRLYQWVNPLAQDVIFAEFNITNLGVTDIDSTAFGWWTDNGIGNNPPDNGLFAKGEGERDFDLAIGYNDPANAIDQNGLPTGIAGYAFLESPGINDDNIDNDRDGMMDERRDNDAGTFYDDPFADPRIVSAEDFQATFGREPGPHWEGDEDGDWVPFVDLNGNDVYDFGEAINNDVGSDGVGPGDLNYFGPDADGTEANLRPDQGEPNFGRVDKDESDQLGMTYFRMITVPDHPNPQPNRFQADWFSDDETWWGWLSTDSIYDAGLLEANLVMIFASGTFPLESKRTERFSMIIARTLGGRDDISEMIDLKKTVQAIYNTDYQFSQPPTKPTVTAVAGDGEVRLFWDNLAETSTDPFLGQNVQDFSGYRIYRATDPFFSEITLVTDEGGAAILKKPLAIFDKKDGYEDAHPILVNGAPYDMGDESGIQNRYIDTDVLNGLTYYYAVTAFDTGSVTRGLGPTENTTIIEVNSIGNPLFSDRNTVFITPGPRAAGYQPPNVDGDVDQLTEGWGTGRILGFDEDGGSEIVNPDVIEDNTQYRVSFFSEKVPRRREINTTAYSVSRFNNSEETVLIDKLPWEANEDGVLITGIFEGLILALKNDTTILYPEETGWLNGDEVTPANKGWTVNIKPDSGAIHYIPHSDIELRFVGEDTLIAPRGRGAFKFLADLPINFMAIAADSARLNVSIIDVDSSDTFELENDAIQIWERIPPIFFYSYWNLTFQADNASSLGDGDVFRIRTRKEFVTGDYFDFSTTSAFVDQTVAKNVLKKEKVAVVPNPYIFTNPLDPADPFKLGRENRLMFTNTPTDATIRIFTLSGKAVDKIEVNNTAERGIVYWDLKSSEKLKVAPGIYIFHIKDNTTGEEQIGRFVIIR